MALSDKKVLIVTSEFGVEEPELLQPAEKLRAAGLQVTVASTGDTAVQTVSGDKDWASVFTADTSLGEVDGSAFDLVVVPGGTVNADVLRVEESVRSLIASFASAGKPVAAICHAPWVFVDAGVAAGKTVTSYASLQLDLQNAGATWVDEPVKRCPAEGWVSLTSRDPGDLDAFCEAIVAELS